jgi:hypothetical protein
VRIYLVSLSLALILASQLVEADTCGADPETAFVKFIRAFNSLDWAAFHGCIADSVSLFNPDIPEAISLHRLDGRSEVESNFRAVFDAAQSENPEQRGPHINPEHVLVQRIGNSAIVSFEFKRSEHSFGRRTIVFSEHHGIWQIVHIHASNANT